MRHMAKSANSKELDVYNRANARVTAVSLFVLNRTSQEYSRVRKCALCVLLLFLGEPCAAQTMFSTEREFGPVRFSQKDLLETVNRLRDFAERQGSTTNESGNARHTLSLSDGQNTLELTEDLSMETLRAAPPVAKSVQYTRRDPTGIIRAIRLSFSDSSRTLRVTGDSQDQVDAVANLGEMLIRRDQVAFGGSNHRGIAGSVLLVLGLLLVFSARRLREMSWLWYLVIVTGCLCSISVWALPWDEWFPGSIVYRDDVSFWVRNAALISLLGFLATIVTLFMGIVRGLPSRLQTRASEGTEAE